MGAIGSTARSLTAKCQTELVCGVRSASFPNRRNVAVAFRVGAAAFFSCTEADRGKRSGVVRKTGRAHDVSGIPNASREATRSSTKFSAKRLTFLCRAVAREARGITRTGELEQARPNKNRRHTRATASVRAPGEDLGKPETGARRAACGESDRHRARLGHSRRDDVVWKRIVGLPLSGRDSANGARTNCSSSEAS